MKKKLLIISLFLIVTFLSFFCIKIVENDSMFPVIKNNDVIIVLPLFSIKKNLIYGFKYNNNIYIKRAVALPKDLIEIKKGKIFINYLEYNYNYVNKFENLKPIMLKKNEYFFLGDNLLTSNDSRNFGVINKKDIKFRVFFIIYPLNRIGFVK